MAGILTKGITLAYGPKGTTTQDTPLTNLMEIPEIGNGEKEMIDVTVLTDDVKKSIAGLGDSAQTLAFKFLYEEEQFQALAALEELGEPMKWRVSMPGKIYAVFDAVASVRFDSAAPNAALTYTLNLSVESAIEFKQ